MKVCCFRLEKQKPEVRDHIETKEKVLHIFIYTHRNICRHLEVYMARNCRE